MFWLLLKLFQEPEDDANCFTLGNMGLNGVSWGRSCVVPLEEQHPASSGLKKRKDGGFSAASR